MWIHHAHVRCWNPSALIILHVSQHILDWLMSFDMQCGHLQMLPFPWLKLPQFLKNLHLAAVGFCCWARAFSSCGEQGLL